MKRLSFLDFTGNTLMFRTVEISNSATTKIFYILKIKLIQI